MSMPETKFMDILSSGLGGMLPRFYGQKMRYFLMVFPPEHGELAGYVSNCPRAELIAGLRRAADRLEAGDDIELPTGSA